MPYVSITQLAQEHISQRLQAGQIAIDATAGNGYDTVFLAQSVGDEGVVYGFDVQQRALQNTYDRLVDAKLEHCVTLIEEGHENMAARIPTAIHGQVAAIMFNLGYLPGSDKAITTQPKTTWLAINAATRLLAPNGMMTVVAYRGHAGAQDEAGIVAHVLDLLENNEFIINRYASPGPYLYIVEKTIGMGSK